MKTITEEEEVLELVRLYDTEDRACAFRCQTVAGHEAQSPWEETRDDEPAIAQKADEHLALSFHTLDLGGHQAACGMSSSPPMAIQPCVHVEVAFHGGHKG